MATATSTDKWIEELKGISVLELAERIKALEEEFGVSAAAMAAPAAAAPAGGGDAAGEAEEQIRRPGRQQSRQEVHIAQGFKRLRDHQVGDGQPNGGGYAGQ